MWSVPDKAIVRARSVQRKSASARWNAEVLEAVNQRPQDVPYWATAAPTGWREPGEGFASRPAPEDEAPKTRLSHRTPWVAGNHEDGYMIGLEDLIQVWEGLDTKVGWHAEPIDGPAIHV